MPTSTEMQELVDECTWTWKQVNGVYGYEVKSKASGNTNSIFLPAAGSVIDGSLDSVGSSGIYNSSSRSEYASYILGIHSSTINLDEFGMKPEGHTIRPIQDAPSV